MSLHTCARADCDRQFLDRASLEEHAEAVHSFNDIENLLRDSLREAYGKPSNANGSGGVCVWVVDVADDWVVFQVETDSDCNLYKVGYTIDSSNGVSLDKPVEVVRRTVYDPVTAPDAAPATLPGLEGAAAVKAKAAPDAGTVAATKALTPAQLATYKKMRAKGMAHAVALPAAKKATS